MRSTQSLPIWLCLIALMTSTATDEAAEEAEPQQALSQKARMALLIDVTAPEGTAPITLESRRGAQGLLVVFLSNSCPYVLDWADRLPKLAAQSAQSGVGLVFINSNAKKRQASDSPQEMRDFAVENMNGQAYFLDDESHLADLMGAERTPEAFLFDADLGLVYRGPIDDHSGPFENAREHWLHDAVNSLGSDLMTPESRPALGCKIQRPRRRAARATSSGGS